MVAQDQTGDAFQDEVGRSIGPQYGGANKSQPGHFFRDFPGQAGALLGDGKHAVRIQCIGKHSPVSWLEDVKGHHRAGEQRGLRQDHDGQYRRHFHADTITCELAFGKL